MQKFTIRDFNQMFPDDDTCLEWLKDHLNPNGIYCEKCEGVTKHHRVASRKSYSCDRCGNHYHPTAGTIYHKSRTPLTLWFYAIYLMAQTRCGISAKQLQRELGVTYKTAWRMFKQIRSMLDEPDGPLDGEVEVDETYMGGRRRGVPGHMGRGTLGKKPVVGAVERQGRVKAEVIDNVKASTLTGFVKRKVMPRSTVYTDELSSYQHLGVHGYNHRRIHHSKGVWVRGTIHTNSIEGFWSLVKRGISGVYHAVGAHYLQTYFNEYSFRYNHRNDVRPMFLTMVGRVSVHQVPF